MNRKDNFLWMAIRMGLLAGGIGIYLCLVGMVETFSKRDVIEDVINLGVFPADCDLDTGRIRRRFSGPPAYPASAEAAAHNLLAALVAGLVTSLVLAALVLIGQVIDLRCGFHHRLAGAL